MRRIPQLDIFIHWDIKLSADDKHQQGMARRLKTSPFNLIVVGCQRLCPDSWPHADSQLSARRITFDDAGGGGCEAVWVTLAWRWRPSSLRATPPWPAIAQQPDGTGN